MNVYILEVAGRLAAQGVHVDVFARCRGGTDHEVKEVATGARVIPIKAGPCTPLPKADLPRYLPEFLGGVLHEARFHGIPYDVVHSHYWLSGWVGRAVKEVWDAPLVASFHTLGKVKNYSLARDERPESAVRLDGEERVIGAADRILAATPLEAGQLVGLYRADPEHVRLIPPGVDHVLFSPRDRMAARERLHLTHLRFALYVGRLQPHKGPDVAIRTVAEAVARDPETTRDLVLGIVGGPSSGSCRISTRRQTWCSSRPAPSRSGWSRWKRPHAERRWSPRRSAVSATWSKTAGRGSSWKDTTRVITPTGCCACCGTGHCKRRSERRRRAARSGSPGTSRRTKCSASTTKSFARRDPLLAGIAPAQSFCHSLSRGRDLQL
jgi:glycosyltransferase involved in cell wall biosynthesis